MLRHALLQDPAQHGVLGHEGLVLPLPRRRHVGFQGALGMLLEPVPVSGCGCGCVSEPLYKSVEQTLFQVIVSV